MFCSITNLFRPKPEMTLLEKCVAVNHLITVVFGFALFPLAIFVIFDTELSDLFGGVGFIFRYVGAPLMIAGFTTMMLGILGFAAVAERKRKVFVKLYCIVIAIMLSCETIAVTMAVGFNNEHYITQVAVDNILTEYGKTSWTGRVATKFWDSLQVERKCCGFNGGFDYEGSWYASGHNLTHCSWPRSCCASDNYECSDVGSCLNNDTWKAKNTNIAQGCKLYLLEKSKVFALAVGLIALFLAVWHIITMALFLTMCRYKQDTSQGSTNYSLKVCKATPPKSISKATRRFKKKNQEADLRRSLLHTQPTGVVKVTNEICPRQQGHCKYSSDARKKQPIEKVQNGHVPTTNGTTSL